MGLLTPQSPEQLRAGDTVQYIGGTRDYRVGAIHPELGVNLMWKQDGQNYRKWEPNTANLVKIEENGND